MRNTDIARVFEHLATMLEIEGENPFRIRAYREGARVVENHPEPMTTLAYRFAVNYVVYAMTH